MLGMRDERFVFCDSLEDVKFSRAFGVDVLHDYTARSFSTRWQCLLDHKGVFQRPGSVKISVVALIMNHREIHKPEFGRLIQIFAVAQPEPVKDIVCKAVTLEGIFHKVLNGEPESSLIRRCSKSVSIGRM